VPAARAVGTAFTHRPAGIAWPMRNTVFLDELHHNVEEGSVADVGFDGQSFQLFPGQPAFATNPDHYRWRSVRRLVAVVPADS